MRNKIYICTVFMVFLVSCHSLDLNPLSQGSSENWFSNDTEIEMALNRLYNARWWNPSPDPDNWENNGWLSSFTDDYTNRNAVTAITGGTITGQTTVVCNWWIYYYNAIASSNLTISKLGGREDIAEDKLNRYIAAARFARAYQYSWLIFLWGDVPFYTAESLSIEEAFALGRTPKAEVLQQVYADFDFAAENLPVTYKGSELQYGTKGAALALKARIALYMGDYQTAKTAAKACMDLGVYQLYSNFGELFLASTKNSVETIFGRPRSTELSSYFIPKGIAQQPMPRNASGNDYVQPSWDLFNAFLCDDGLPIDESPRYNPQKPFEHRDPRCTATIVEFGTPFCGYIWEPHPDSLKTTNVVTGARVTNQDSRGVGQYASYNGLAWRKGIDDSWTEDFMPDPDIIVIRYADVLLIYAEAKIELNEIDGSVLDAMNMVRSRAYGVSYSKTASYPPITTTSQAQLRQTLRIERRMEFAFEGLGRYADILRWKLAEKVLNTTIYGMIDPPEQREKIVKPGLWFFPEVVPIDEDGVSDFSSMFNKGYIKILAQRSFDKSKHYLWPIPSSEILINNNLEPQNPGY